MTTTPLPRWKKIRLILSGLVVAAVFVVMAVRQHRVTARYAVNMMYWDQWDFYKPLFGHQSWWDCYDYQHGPHKQGVGMLLTRVLADLTHWNSRADAFGVSFCLIVAAAIAIPLAWKVGIREPLLLAGVPLIYLNIRQYEGLVDSANISHGAMPILLFTIYCLAWFIRQNPVRLVVLCVLTFGLIFTGFGLFVGVIAPVILLVELVQSVVAKKPSWAVCVVLALGVVAASWWAFGRNYHFDPSADHFEFPCKSPMDYLYFVSVMMANFFGVGHGTAGTIEPYVTIFGAYMFGALMIIAIIHGWKMVRSGVLSARPSVVIFALSSFALIYAANTAVGRVSLDWRVAGMASRYITLLIPGGFAILLHLATIKRRFVAVPLAVIFLLVLAYGTKGLYPRDLAECETFRDGRKNWKAAYLKIDDEVKTQNSVHFAIYPTFGIINQRLEYLKQNQLNLFAPDKKSGH